MPEIKPEYPEGQHSIEMVLTEMIAEKRSWHDRQRIGNALWAVRRHAKNLQNEQARINSSIGGNCTSEVEV